MPSRLNLWLAPVESDDVWNQIQFWKEPCFGLDFSPVQAMAVNSGCVVKLQLPDLIAEPQCGATLEPWSDSLLRLQMVFSPKRSGILHGIGGWFSAQLSETTTLSNSPTASERINRPNVFFPISQPIPITQRDQVRVGMRILPAHPIIAWNVSVNDDSEPAASKASYSHSTFEGTLICKEDLEKGLPTYIPKLDKWGKARLSLLSLCNGDCSLQEIEREVYRRHPDIFGGLSEAEAFVAEGVTKYSM
jgi:protein arginine N-methyltransferase 1